MKKLKKEIVILVIAIVVGMGVGVGLAVLEDHLGYELGMDRVFLTILFLVFGMWLAVILHEGGHMVCALMSGYRFVSFRIGSIMLLKDNTGFHLKRFTLAGTGGQCLMDPPEMKDGDFPYTLYNLGGVLANLLTVLVCAAVCLAARPGELGLLFCISFGAISLYLGIVNGIPLRVSGLDNDGRNILSMKKSAVVRKCLWAQLRVNGELARGTRLRDMPKEWFELPGTEEMKECLAATVGCLAVSRLLDEGKYEEAAELGEMILEKAAGLVDVQKKMLLGELLFQEIIREQRPEKMKEYDTKEFQKFLAVTKRYPSTVRLQYAHALLVEKDQAKAEKKKVYFEQVIKTYPNAGEIPGERELIAMAEKKGA